MKNHSKGQNGGRRRSRGRGREHGSETPAPEAAAGTIETANVLGSTNAVTDNDPQPKHFAAATLAAPEMVHPQPVEPSAEGTIQSSIPQVPTRDRAVQIVQGYVPLAVGAGMIPLPGLDLVAIGGLQLKVLAALAKHYGVPFTREQGQLIVTSLLGSVGTTVLAGATLVSLAKTIPVFGTLVGAASMPVAGGVVTRAFGNLAIDHFEAGGTMESFDLDVAQQAFLQKIAEAKAAAA